MLNQDFLYPRQAWTRTGDSSAAREGNAPTAPLPAMTVWLVVVASAVFGLFATAHAQTGAREGLGREIADARDKIYPALVNISVFARDFSGGRAVRYGSAGSGTIISPAGHVLTNYHVVRGATRIVCTLVTGEQIAANVVGEDPETDLAILELDLAKRDDANEPLPFATISTRDELRVGDRVLAVGNPLSLSSSMTLGIVSNTRRVFVDPGGNSIESLIDDGGEATGMFTRWIQHDALILPGNSGGPLVDLSGDIVGVNTRGGNGYGFASPAPLVRRVVTQLLAFGEVRRGWLGAAFLPVGKIDRKTGALVATVLPDSPAAKCGLAPGDILLRLDGDVVTARFFEEIPSVYERIAEKAPASRAELTVERHGEVKKLSATLEARSRLRGEERELRSLGITVREITKLFATARRWPDAHGVLVTGTRTGFAFEEAKPAIDGGSVVLEVGGVKITDLATFVGAVEKVAGKDDVAVTFRRGGEILVTSIDLSRDDRRPPGGALPRPWIGVKTQVLTPEVAGAIGHENQRGFRVTEVFPYTRAAKAGLRAGDLVLAVDGEKLEAYRPQDARDFENRIEDEFAIGEEVELSILRAGKSETITVELEPSPGTASEAKTARDDFFELAVRDLTFMDRISFKLDETETGVIVTEAANGGFADVAGLSSGQLIRRIAGRPITDTEAFEATMKDLHASRPRVVPVFVQRGYDPTFVFIEPDWRDDDENQAK